MGTGASKHSCRGSGAWLRSDDLRTFRRVVKSSQPERVTTIRRRPYGCAGCGLRDGRLGNPMQHERCTAATASAEQDRAGVWIGRFYNKITKSDLGFNYFGGNGER